MFKKLRLYEPKMTGAMYVILLYSIAAGFADHTRDYLLLSMTFILAIIIYPMMHETLVTMRVYNKECPYPSRVLRSMLDNAEVAVMTLSKEQIAEGVSWYTLSTLVGNDKGVYPMMAIVIMAEYHYGRRAIPDGARNFKYRHPIANIVLRFEHRQNHAGW